MTQPDPPWTWEGDQFDGLEADEFDDYDEEDELI